MKSRNEFGRLLNDNKCTIGAEIGVKEGFFSKIITDVYKGNIIGVDIWDDQGDYQQAQENYKSLNGRMIQGRSTDVAKEFADESLDWVYIDADHSYKAYIS